MSPPENDKKWGIIGVLCTPGLFPEERRVFAFKTPREPLGVLSGAKFTRLSDLRLFPACEGLCGVQKDATPCLRPLPPPALSSPAVPPLPQDAESLQGDFPERTFAFLSSLSCRLRLLICLATIDDTVMPFYYWLRLANRLLALDYYGVAHPRLIPRLRLERSGAERRWRFADRMALRSVPLLLLVLAVVALPESCFGSSSHSLKYFYTSVSDPSQGLPHFVAPGYVDDQVFIYYDSSSRKVQPGVSWMEEVGKEDPQYWETETQGMRGQEEVFRADLEILRSRYNQSEGLHTWQWMYGCELQGNEIKGGFMHFGYDGRTFLTFDKKTLTWVASEPQAQITQRKWDAVPGLNQGTKAYLEEECIEWLKRYLSYGKETLLRTEAPVVTVSSRTEADDGMETHVCRVDGFYPKEIDASWRRDGEVWLQDTFRGFVAPNADGTYHYWLSLRIDPQERDHYQCHVEHDGLQEPVDKALKGSSSHSLKYFYTGVSEPSQELPQFVAPGYVDDQVFTYYDSNTRMRQPRVSWMEKVGKEHPQYWENETHNARGNEELFRADLETLQTRYNQTKGLHTWQLMYGCELRGDGSKGGFMQFGYDGRTFLTFHKETLTWVTSEPQAQITQRKWDAVPGYNHGRKAYLEEECIEWLKKYLSYGKETLLRTEAPVVTVSSRMEADEGMETHVCRVDGFYPKEIDASWRRDGEVWLQDTFRGFVAPNADGTYHYWLSLRIDPQERDRYRCHVEHDGLREPVDVAVKESNLGLIIIVCVVAAVVLVIAVTAGILVYRKKHQEGYKAASTSDKGSHSSGPAQLWGSRLLM